MTPLRSGCRIDERRAPGYGRPAGHAGGPPNLGDTAVPCWTGPEAARLYPGWSPAGVFDVSGGWYDAGDYGKYVVSGSIALWQLLHLLRLLRRHPRASLGRLPAEAELVEECRWQLDWLLRMQVPPGYPLAGMAFHRVHGTEWSPIRSARAHPDLSAPDDEGRNGGGLYGDARLADDFYWAGVGLWLATGEEEYRTALTGSPEHTAEVFDLAGFDFHQVAGPALRHRLRHRYQQASTDPPVRPRSRPGPPATYLSLTVTGSTDRSAGSA